MILAHFPTQIEHLYPKETIMVVIKPLYGIAEAGTHWWAIYFNHYCEKLNMTISTYNSCLLISSSKQFVIVGIQMDDTLILCDSGFNQLEEDELKKAEFTTKPKQELTTGKPLLFNGCTLIKKTNRSIHIQQKK
jgi:hypothetical protein